MLATGRSADRRRDLASRILFLADGVFDDIPGGSRVVARELARGLARRGHEVTFLVGRHGPEAPDDERRDGIRIVRYAGAGQGPAFVRAGQAAFARLWAENPFDIVHTHFAYAAVGPLKMLPRHVPHVRTFHGPWDEEGWFEEGGEALHGLPRVKALLKKRIRFKIEHQNLHRSARVIVLSDVFGKQVTDRFKVAARDVSKISGGVDLMRFSPTGEKKQARRSLGLPEDRVLLLSVRRLAARMGLGNLVEAMPAIVAQFPQVLLLIGGKGPERERLECRVKELRLADHVRLLGFIPDDQLAAYYQAADLFVLPTTALEGFGLVTVEALASGTPVVGTPIGATPEILRGLDERLVTADATPAALAQGVLAFLGGEWSRALSPERLRCFVEEHYTWERHIDAVQALYTELAGKG